MAKKNKVKNRFLREEISIPSGIDIQEMEEFSKISYPLFSFKYLQDTSVKGCKDAKFHYDFLMRMKKLGELGWDGIQKSDRHSFGMEKISQSCIKPELPSHITPEVTLYAFRANGNNLPFVGYREGKIFQVVFIETKFGDIYNHS